MKTLRYSIILFGIILTGCHLEDPAAPQDSLLKIQAEIPALDMDVKSTLDLGTDAIYAYPFSLPDEYANLNGTTIFPSEVNGSTYSYKMPNTVYDVIFTSILDGEYICETSDTSPIFTVSMPDMTSGCSEDFVLGTLPKSEIEAENSAAHSVVLKRKVAQISVSLRSKKADSEDIIEDLSEYFSKVELYIPINGTYTVETFPASELTDTYSEQINAYWNVSDISAASEVVIAKEKFIFPSYGTDNASLRLVLTTVTGNKLDITRSMTQRILANKHYNLTLTLRQKSSDFDFSVESIEEVSWDDIPVSGDDMVTLSVTPTLNVEMNTKAESGYSHFTLGEEDLYCYCFSTLDAGGLKLEEGFPKKQSQKSNGSYMYQMPEGQYSLMFSNIDFTADTEYVPAESVDFDNFDFYNFLVTMPEIIASKDLVISSRLTSCDITEGCTVTASLDRKTTGYRFLLDIPGVTDISAQIDALWLSLDGAGFYSSYNLYGGSGEHSDTAFHSEMIDAATISKIQYNGQDYFAIYPNIFAIQYLSYVDITLDILTAASETKSFKKNGCTVTRLGNNNIIITIPSSSL